MIFRSLLTIVVFENFLIPCEAINGMIWSKNRQSFVQIFSIPSFAAERQERLAESRRTETHNFNKEAVTAAYYEEKNMIEFYDNDTKIRGVCGELWNLLADFSNFTLVPIKSKQRSFGVQLPNGSYDGLMGLIERNEAQVILRTGFYLHRLNMITYAMPLWKSSYRLYIRPKSKHDSHWVITLFSREAWYAILLCFLSLCVIGFFLEKVCCGDPNSKKHRNFDVSDHVFYTFAMMCTQGYIPSDYYNRWKILNLSKSIFAWLILIAFSSNLIYRMAYRNHIPPFHDIPSLVNDTNYSILAFEGSMVYESFKKMLYRLGDKKTIDQRVKFLNSTAEMFSRVCNEKGIAVFQNADKYKTYSRFSCQLVPVGKLYFSTWISSAVAKSYKYKKVFDMGMLKLTEVGLMDELRDRFLQPKMVTTTVNLFRTVNLTQVSLIFIMFSAGIIMSILVLIIENIFYLWDVRP